jgi:hypothetical protein
MLTKEGLAAEIMVFARTVRGRHLGEVQVAAESSFARWQDRMISLAPEQWMIVKELREEMPGLSLGMPQYEAYGNFLEKELSLLVRVMRGLPAVNARFEAYQAGAAREARAARDVLPVVQLRRERDGGQDRFPDRRDNRERQDRDRPDRDRHDGHDRRQRPASRQPDSSRQPDADEVQMLAVVRALYADRTDLAGRCFVCEYIGSVPPGLPAHVATSCTQRQAAIRKMRRR